MNPEVVLCQLDYYIRTYPKNEDIKQAKEIRNTIQNDPSTVDRPEFQTIIHSARLSVDCGWRPTISSSMSFYKNDILHVFCDGSCRRNGKVGAKAGYGIYVTKNGESYHSYSAALSGEEPQTNQRAELLALQYAIHYVAEGGFRGAIIYSDSKYAIQCLTVWSKAWKAAGWKKSDKQVISHVDIIPSMCELWESISDYTQLVHVFGHTGGKDAISAGNAEADRLACEATD